MTTAWNGGRNTRLLILARSRSGRWIQKWESVRKLRTFRLKKIPRESPLFENLMICSFDANDLQTLSLIVQSEHPDPTNKNGATFDDG